MNLELRIRKMKMFLRGIEQEKEYWDKEVERAEQLLEELKSLELNNIQTGRILGVRADYVSRLKGEGKLRSTNYLDVKEYANRS